MVVGAMADISPMELQGFYNIGAMGGKRFQNQPEKSCRPFDKDHEGFIYGQSAGCLILESAESVIRRHAIAHAEILGGVLLLDGNRLSDSNEEGETRVMQAALKYSNNNIDQVDYINTHGSSSPLGDKVELKAIRNVFQDDVSRIWLNSTKSLTGHCLYSAGIIETIASVLQMENGYIHPNLNLDNPIDSECRLNGLKSVEADINIAMNNSFGFGGINSSIIIRKGHKNGSRN